MTRDAERTVVLIAHHDAAHSGLVFHPALPELADRLGLIERTDTSPPLMAPVLGGPVLAALGAADRPPPLAKLGLFLGLGSVAAMADIGPRKIGARRQRQRHRGGRPCSPWPSASSNRAARGNPR